MAMSRCETNIIVFLRIVMLSDNNIHDMRSGWTDTH